MRTLTLFADAIDRVNGLIGRGVAWLSLAMVLLGAGNSVARYVGQWMNRNLSSNSFLEGQWYLFSALFLLAGANVLGRDGHVRVDVVHGRLGPRGRAWVDLIGTLVFLVPFSTFLLVVSWPFAVESLRVLEMSPDPGGLPRYPIKAVIPLAALMLMAQAFAQAVRQVAILRADDPGVAS